MKLYTATIRGRKYYFTGNLNAEVIQSCEHFCMKLEASEKDTTPLTLFEYLLNHINLDLGYIVTPVNIEHIFRINY